MRVLLALVTLATLVGARMRTSPPQNGGAAAPANAAPANDVDMLPDVSSGSVRLRPGSAAADVAGGDVPPPSDDAATVDVVAGGGVRTNPYPYSSSSSDGERGPPILRANPATRVARVVAGLPTTQEDIEDYLGLVTRSNPVVIFSKSYCPYCKRAKDALTRASSQTLRSSGPLIVELDSLPSAQASTVQDALASLTGFRTVPSVWVGGECIGGGDDTVALLSSGQLALKILEAHRPEETARSGGLGKGAAAAAASEDEAAGVVGGAGARARAGAEGREATAGDGAAGSGSATETSSSEPQLPPRPNAETVASTDAAAGAAAAEAFAATVTATEISVAAVAAAEDSVGQAPDADGGAAGSTAKVNVDLLSAARRRARASALPSEETAAAAAAAAASTLSSRAAGRLKIGKRPPASKAGGAGDGDNGSGSGGPPDAGASVRDQASLDPASRLKAAVAAANGGGQEGQPGAAKIEDTAGVAGAKEARRRALAAAAGAIAAKASEGRDLPAGGEAAAEGAERSAAAPRITPIKYPAAANPALDSAAADAGEDGEVRSPPSVVTGIAADGDRDWLARWFSQLPAALQPYQGTLRGEGFDSAESVATLSEQDFIDMAVKRGHARLFSPFVETIEAGMPLHIEKKRTLVAPKEGATTDDPGAVSEADSNAEAAAASKTPESGGGSAATPADEGAVLSSGAAGAAGASQVSQVSQQLKDLQERVQVVESTLHLKKEDGSGSGVGTKGGVQSGRGSTLSEEASTDEDAAAVTPPSGVSGDTRAATPEDGEGNEKAAAPPLGSTSNDAAARQQDPASPEAQPTAKARPKLSKLAKLSRLAQDALKTPVVAKVVKAASSVVDKLKRAAHTVVEGTDADAREL